MPRMMTKAEARAWRERWHLVNEFVIEEARAATPEERLRDLDVLFRSRSLFRWPDDEADIAEARQRWIRLKEAASAR